jgi:hypothetical protein
MAEKSEFVLEDFTEVTRHIDRALDRINTIYKSTELTEERKSELGRLGRSLHQTGHEIGHFFLTLDSLPSKLKEELQEYFAH